MKRAVFRIEGQRKSALETARERLALVLLVFVFAFIALAGRLFQLTVIEGATERERIALAPAQRHPPRADIIERNGILMATSIPSVTLAVRPSRLIDRQGTADKIAAILPEFSRAYIAARIAPRAGVVQIKQHLSPREHYLLNAIGDPGIEFVKDYKRVYPNGALAAHAVGFTDADGVGRLGIEGFLNDRLVAAGAEGAAQPMAIDLRIQHAVEDELWRAMSRHQAIGAAGIVLDIRNGQVLAMASLPDFDPNAVGKSPVSFQTNRATNATYELGSVFKIFTLAGALDLGVISLADRFDATAPLRVGKYSIRDDHPENRWLTTPEVLIHSSNIASARIALAMGPERQRRFLDALGLLQPLALEVRETASPQVWGRWGELKAMTISYGHGLAVSPMHVAQAAAAILNGGTLIQATLLADDDEAGLIVGRQVIAAQTSRAMRELMRLVVTDGTGGNADVPGYRIGGKTGTAEKASGRSYQRHANITTFLGAFPMDDPRYVVMAMLDEAKPSKETMGFAGAGWMAAPIVRNVVLRAAPLLGVAPSPRDVDVTLERLVLSTSARRQR
ncbi:MAG: peptidoglycan D,D-transpeptidase FtsI family protein [Pseudomonadota bacterium]